MARSSRAHELHLAASNCFPDSVREIREAFLDVLPIEHLHVWDLPRSVSELPATNAWRRMAAEIVRNEAIRKIRPDALHISSLLEGLGDDAIVTVDPMASHATGITLYDLIPLQHSSIYLSDSRTSDWYRKKLSEMAKADLWLAISESSRREGIELLGLNPDQVVNISCGANDIFRVIPHDQASREALRSRYGIEKPFVMYTGGIDYRKNIEGLIDAYAALPGDMRAAHQLAIVCSVTPDQRAILVDRARRAGLADGDVLLTGYVSDDELVALYNFCKLFVFPSWHEGFGLPVLEAMRCGAAVIGSDCTSVPEVIGRKDAQFDPLRTSSIAERLHQALSDDEFRRDLQASSVERAKLFSWDASASAAWDAFEEHGQRRLYTPRVVVPSKVAAKPRLAYVSPLPPDRSGIADYSAELLPALSKHYDIDLVSLVPTTNDEWLHANLRIISPETFELTADRYDRVLYHVGNSSFHTHMPALLQRIPGTVVLHDFFLSGLTAYMQHLRMLPDGFAREIEFSHGAGALLRHLEHDSPADSISRFPCNRTVLSRANGVICHSNHSRELAERWYGPNCVPDWATVPHARADVARTPRAQAREALGLPDDAFVVCCFGFVSHTKLSDRVVSAWQSSSAHGNAECRLVFVGENDGLQFGKDLLRQIRSKSPAGQITITGYASLEQYRLWLSVADAAIQLRALSRGETSGTVLDAMVFGVPVVANAHGSLAELPADVVTLLPEDVSVEQLRETIDSLYKDRDTGAARGQRAREYIEKHHSPEASAQKYFEAIEKFAKHGPQIEAFDVLRKIRVLGMPNDPSDLSSIRRSVQAQFCPADRIRRTLIDVTALIGEPLDEGMQRRLKDVLRAYPLEAHVDLVYTSSEGELLVALNFLLQVLGMHWEGRIEDRPVILTVGEKIVPIDQLIELRRGRSASASAAAVL
jgi:glycosyltransferase involved in cell wall biosynthesis